MSEGKQTYTALPWVRDRASGFGCDIRAANGRRIAAVNVQNLAKSKEALKKQQRVNDANAVYIVTACNAFPALVEALERIASLHGTAGTEFESECTIRDKYGSRKGQVRRGVFASDIARDALAALSAASTEGGQ